MIAPRAWNGAQISEAACIEGLSIEEYHGRADLCAGPSISSSGLRTIAAEGAAAYWWTSPLNPHREPPEEKAHFDLGRAAHHLALSEAGFWTKFAVRPAKWKDWRTADAQKWRDEARAAGLTPLTPADLENIRGMAGVLPGQSKMPESGLANSALVKQGLLQGLIEHSLIWRDEETGVWCRARPDNIHAGGFVPDLKTIATASPSKAIWDHGLHCQGAMIRDGLRACAGFEMSAFVLVFVQSRAPYRVTVHELVPYEHPMTGEMVDPIELGAAQNRAALRIFARCLGSGEWPAGDGKSVEERMPEWMVRAAQTRAEEEERLAA